MKRQGSPGVEHSQHGLYDRYGNMNCQLNQQTNGLCPQYSFSTSTNRITNSNFSYDSAGDLTQDGTGVGTHTYSYDAEGRLSSVDNGTTASYVYNALGERAERNAGGTYTEYLYDKDGSEVGENNRTSWTETWAAFQGRHLFPSAAGRRTSRTWTAWGPPRS